MGFVFLRVFVMSCVFAGSMVRSLIRIERFLRRPQFNRHVLQVHADARPGMKPAAHGVDEHIGRSQMRCRFGMPGAPPVEPRERGVFAVRPADFDQRMLRRAAA